MLTALELAGFKSFADKTRLEFPEGVTCVVGPNGSGKSNVVDAIKWVLGSQSPKSLRGQEMTDVIFNGSAGRRPLNSAEVTLEFNNADRIFDVEGPVVRLTRRVYRSGEGEYALNGAACRLRDIRELLAGTGVGSGAYNIIEQGRVDAVLSATPKDRRALFEEAAGISRFRLKKEEAGRRLARVEQNLLRLSDIVDEVESRLKRVRSQAGKARRYREQTDRLKELRTELGLADYRGISTRLSDLQRIRDETAAELGARKSELEEGEEQLTAIQQSVDSAKARLSDVDREWAALREQIAATQAAIAAETVRLRDLEATLSNAKRRLVATRIESSRRSDGATLADLRAQHSEAERRLAEATEQVDAAVGRVRSAESELDQLRRSRAELVAERKRLRGLLATQRRGLDQVAVRAEVARGQLSDGEQLGQQLAAERAAAAKQHEGSQHAIESLSQEVDSIAAEEASVRGRLQDHREQCARQQEALAEIEAEAQGRTQQLKVLEAADLQVERLRDDMAKLLGAGGAGVSVCGLVADLVHVDFDTAPMVEAALGDAIQHLVVDDGRALLSALVRDGDALTARVSFQRLDCHLAVAAIDRIDLSDEPGVLGRADRFVETDAQYTPLVTRLLGRTWVVDTLETAEKLSSTVGKGLNFVTFAGDVIAADGVIRAGSFGDGAGLLTRRKQIEASNEALSGLARQKEETAAAVAEAKREFETAQQHSEQLEHQRRRLSERLADARLASAALGERTNRLEQELARLATERAKQTKLVTTAEAEGNAARESIAQTNAAISDVEKGLSNVDRDAERAQASLSAAKTESEQARVQIAALQQHAVILGQQVDQMAEDARSIRETDAHATAEVRSAEGACEDCRQLLLESRASLAGMQLRAQPLAVQRRGLTATAERDSSRQRRLAEAIHEARRHIDGVQARLQQAELEAERLRMERTSLAKRMQEDYAIDLAAEAAAQPHAPAPEDRGAMQDELDRLREKVGATAAINLESLDELDELESRFEELSTQYTDLSEAKSSLERLSSRISAESRQLFLTTVEEVRGHFRELFRRLFGGGEADLVLLDEEGGDPLDAGVEIAASPPGKELRGISLLSGGEKTLTCVALLLAVFRTKPSPFCVLDEVDAALDESNIGRFIGVLSEFLSSTQFLVVTHSKKTMTGAGTLYGVTMQESGVSKQVAVRFEDVGEDGQINPAATLRRSAPPQARAA